MRTAIESVLAQTYRNIELIVSDNGSSDDTPSIVAEYSQRDARIRYIRHERNRGSTWNFGYVLERAKGKYFMWASIDDWRSPGSVAAMVGALEANPKVVTALTPYVLVGPDAVAIGPPLTPALVDSPSRWRRVLQFAQYRASSTYLYGVHRTEAISGYPFKPFALVPRTSKGMEGPVLCYLATIGALVTVSDESMFLRVRADSEGSRPESAVVHLMCRAQITARTPHAVWSGSKSLPLATGALLAELASQAQQIANIAPRWLRKVLASAQRRSSRAS
jgi:hypothetical protein